MKKIFFLILCLLNIGIYSQATSGKVDSDTKWLIEGAKNGPGNPASMKFGDVNSGGNIEINSGFVFGNAGPGSVLVKTSRDFSVINTADVTAFGFGKFSFTVKDLAGTGAPESVKFGIGTSDPKYTLHLDNLGDNDGVRLGDVGFFRKGLSSRKEIFLESLDSEGTLLLKAAGDGGPGSRITLNGSEKDRGTLQLSSGFGNEGGGDVKMYSHGKFEFINTATSWGFADSGVFTFSNENINSPIKFGIGTNAPQSTLHLDNLAASDGIQFGNKFKIRQFGVEDNNFVLEHLPSTGNMYIRARKSSSDSNSSLYINDYGGNVIIGTAEHRALLYVRGDAYIEKGWLRVNGNQGLYFQDFGGGFRMIDNSWIRTYGGKNFYHDKGIMRTDGVFQVGSGGNRFIVQANGNVGIGTTDTKGFELGVKGKIAAQEVKVALYGSAGWSDFVFEDNYDLPTLTEVETHISEKGHLKDIPSAKEVEKDGFFLGQMDAKLLQKIEELTLYTIQQQKEIEALKGEKKANAELVGKLTNLLERVEKLEAK